MSPKDGPKLDTVVMRVTKVLSKEEFEKGNVNTGTDEPVIKTEPIEEILFDVDDISSWEKKFGEPSRKKDPVRLRHTLQAKQNS
jgi:hypothetical protein